MDAGTQEKLLVSFAILLVLWLTRLLVLVVVLRRSDDVRVRFSSTGTGTSFQAGTCRPS